MDRSFRWPLNTSLLQEGLRNGLSPIGEFPVLGKLFNVCYHTRELTLTRFGDVFNTIRYVVSVSLVRLLQLSLDVETISSSRWEVPHFGSLDPTP